MSEHSTIEGTLRAAPDGRWAIVAARFNGRLVESLIEGAIDCLVRHGVGRNGITVARVPGAWELPLALDVLASRGDLTGMVALGVVIRGETPHFDYVSTVACRGVEEVSRRHGLPVGFGVLTCDTTEQARERAGGKAGNKGWEAAQAAIEMADLAPRLRGGAAGSIS